MKVTVNGVEFDRDNLTMVEHPGKFEGELLVAEVLYDLTLGGGADEEAGSVTETGVWHGLLRGPFDLGDGAEGLNADEDGFLRALKGAILYENELGFVSVAYFTDEVVLNAAWNSILEQVDKVAEEAEAAEVDEEAPAEEAPAGPQEASK